MWIVTDRGSDFAPEQKEDLPVQFVPMRLTLDGKTYSSGEDITDAEFYQLMAQSDGYPTTSQATAGDFAALYRRLAEVEPDILSIHISSGLSGTLDSAHAGAQMVPEARVTFWDTKTLSCPQAWQVETAVRGLREGWPLEQILEKMAKVRVSCEGIFTLDTLKYLIHGGRISHMKGLLASLMHIRPVIAVDKESGKYVTRSSDRTMRKALQSIAGNLLTLYPEGSRLRVQLLHGNNLEGVAILREIVDKLFQVTWLPVATVGPILGAHTGGGLVGLGAGPQELFD